LCWSREKKFHSKLISSWNLGECQSCRKCHNDRRSWRIWWKKEKLCLSSLPDLISEFLSFQNEKKMSFPVKKIFWSGSNGRIRFRGIFFFVVLVERNFKISSDWDLCLAQILWPWSLICIPSSPDLLNLCFKSNAKEKVFGAYTISE
jgi:hypothetical protein